MRSKPCHQLRRLRSASARSQLTLSCAMLVMTQGGCLGYLGAAMVGPGNWEVDEIDVSRISEIVVGETTRDEVEAKFGIPNGRLRYPTLNPNVYSYRISRTSPAGDIVWGIKMKQEGKTLLTVMFNDDDVVFYVSGPELGAVELLEKLADPKDRVR